MVDITILNQKIIYNDDIKIGTEFPCLLGYPVITIFFFVFEEHQTIKYKTFIWKLHFKHFKFKEKSQFIMFTTILFAPPP